MKLLLDFLPIICFFATFKYAESHKDLAAQIANRYLHAFVSGGPITPLEAPILLATGVVIAVTLVLMVVMKLRGQKLDKLLWINVGVVTVLGLATLWFRNEAFIKWKPTMVYWGMALIFLLSEKFTGKSVLRALMGEQMQLPEPVWRNLTLAWFGFFALMGVLNLYIAYNFSTDIWVDFKLFGGIGLMIVFVIAQGIYLGRHIKPQPEESKP